MSIMRSMWACLGALSFLVGCGEGQPVRFASDERPTSLGGSASLPPPSAAYVENPNGHHALPDDEAFVEPEHPAVDTKEERAMVHVHGAKGQTCTGVMIGPRLVATSQQCAPGLTQGVSALDAANAFKVEIPSSTLTWTHRMASHVVLPACTWEDVDVALLVLKEPAPWVVPLSLATVPGPGAKVSALGFGKCTKEAPPSVTPRPGAVVEVSGAAVVIDIPLCRGDVGGPVVDGLGGDLIGLISRRDDPPSSPRKTTTISRLDTVTVRGLVEQAKAVMAGSAAKAEPVSCK